MRPIHLILSASLALLLAGCSEEKPAAPPAQSEQTAPAPAEPTAAPEKPKAAAPESATAPTSDEGCPPDVSEANRADYPACAEEAAAPPAVDTAKPASSSEVSEAAVRACMEAVAKDTNVNDVAVLSSEFSEANSMVMVGVGPDRAPWKCLVSNDGVVAEVSSTVDEGAL